MKRFSVFAALALLCAGAFATDAGKVEIFGKGEVHHKPEQASITVSVVSLCYDHSRDAQVANAELADKLVGVLKTYQRGPSDLVVATGGQTSRQTEYAFDNGGTNRKVLCEMKWRAGNTLTLKTSALTEISDVQDAVLKVIDGAENVKPGVLSQTYAQLGEPTFSLLPATMNTMRAEAQKQAYADAKQQFATFQSVCPFQNPRLVSVTPPGNVSTLPHYAAPAPSESGSSQTPILPDDLVVSATWQFVWAYDPSPACVID